MSEVNREAIANELEAESLRSLAGTVTSPEEYAAAEQSMWRRLSPRRDRWKDIREFDERVRELEVRQTELTATLQALHTKLAAAPAADQAALAEWQLAGARGPRPEPTVEAIEQEFAVHQADHDSITLAVQRTFAEKAVYVEKHRARLRKDAERGLAETYARAVALVDELEQARQAIVVCREEATWAALYPDPATGDPIDSRLLTGGRMQPLKGLLGITTQLDAARAFQAIRADLEWARGALTPAQANALAGVNQRSLHNAVWADSDEGRQTIQDESRQARERHAREWGLQSGEEA